MIRTFGTLHRKRLYRTLHSFSKLSKAKIGERRKNESERKINKKDKFESERLTVPDSKGETTKMMDDLMAVIAEQYYGA